MDQAFFTASWSEDPSKQVGSVLVRDNRIVSVGYNGFPTGVEHFVERLEKPEKLQWIEHAERNSIYTASKMGHGTEGCILFSTFFPCPSCSRAVIQAGIVEVVTMEPNPDSSWYKNTLISLAMFDEANIKVTLLNQQEYDASRSNN